MKVTDKKIGFCQHTFQPIAIVTIEIPIESMEDYRHLSVDSRNESVGASLIDAINNFEKGIQNEQN